MSQVYSGTTSNGLNTSYPNAWINGMIRAFLVASSVCRFSFTFSIRSDMLFNWSLKSILIDFFNY
ncbi:hypothetical protein Barb4_03287 [Bacteroidales bacterium Barb4]|nr:hypothetical protein Barb4_03287 [Bacteroidales bacterium Barb4]